MPETMTDPAPTTTLTAVPPDPAEAANAARPAGLETDELPPSLAAYRMEYRSNVIGRYYNGFAHLAFVVAGSSAVIVLALSQVSNPTWLDWLCVPVTFVLANFVEYFGHRGPMHKHVHRLGLMFHRHTHEHHRFFTDEWMTCRSQRDFKIVLFPAIMLLFYLGIVAFPIGLGLYLFHTRNTACFYVATATFYFMSYEVLHFCYHLDESSFVARLPVIRALRAHHRMHHRHSLMSKYNFNITWPIADFFFGTIYREGRPDGK
ncbi:MAG: sterol desaturase family protein [Planctomycetia bacterium]|nr:sterol desaturase family protein [Planctomycetia bacterium]